MTRTFRGLAIMQLLWALSACRDEGDPSRPIPSSPVYPVLGGEAGPPPGVDAGSGTDPVQGVDPPASPPADGGGGSPAPDQLPCDVASFLGARCLSCHGSTPLPGIPMSLATYADLTMRSRAYPGETHAQRALTRIQLGSMPPGGGLSAAEIELFAGWVQGGVQPGTCGGSGLDAGAGKSDPGMLTDAAATLDGAAHDAAGSPAAQEEAGPRDAGADGGLAEASTAGEAGASDAGASDAGSPNGCSSGIYWDGGMRGSPLMTPGQPCLSCHAAGTPLFSFAGTAFAGAHEPDDCYGAIGNGVSIVIKGANGQRLSITPNSAGNFIASANVPLPYTVEVLYQGRKRVKTQPQMSGDCNACHSQKGASGAAGRIVLP